MPNKPPKACKLPTCHQLTSSWHGYCSLHAGQQYAKKKGKTTKERGYGYRWQQIRAALLARQPVCTFPDCKKLAQEVDHVDGDKDNLSSNNLRPYCKEHHTFKTYHVDNLPTKTMTWQQWEAKYPRVYLSLDF